MIFPTVLNWKTAFAVMLFDLYFTGNRMADCILMRKMLMNAMISRINLILRWLTFTLYFQVKELPTYKDVDFRNSMQKVYVSDEEKEKIMEKLSRDIEVRAQCRRSTQQVFPLT